jgi:hypothetical protein
MLTIHYTPKKFESTMTETLILENNIQAIDGKRTTTPKRGINIIQMSDGTTKKVVVK